MVGLTQALLDPATEDTVAPCGSILLPGRVLVGVKEGVPIEASHRGQEEGRSSWLLGWLYWLVALLQGGAQLSLGQRFSMPDPTVNDREDKLSRAQATAYVLSHTRPATASACAGLHSPPRLRAA